LGCELKPIDCSFIIGVMSVEAREKKPSLTPFVIHYPGNEYYRVIYIDRSDSTLPLVRFLDEKVEILTLIRDNLPCPSMIKHDGRFRSLREARDIIKMQRRELNKEIDVLSGRKVAPISLGLVEDEIGEYQIDFTKSEAAWWRYVIQNDISERTNLDELLIVRQAFQIHYHMSRGLSERSTGIGEWESLLDKIQPKSQLEGEIFDVYNHFFPS
jgi:hypothetical protein